MILSLIHILTIWSLSSVICGEACNYGWYGACLLYTSSDPFWTKAETALLQAIILMLFQEAPEYEQNFSMVMRVLEYAEVREEDDE